MQPDLLTIDVMVFSLLPMISDTRCLGTTMLIAAFVTPLCTYVHRFFRIFSLSSDFFTLPSLDRSLRFSDRSLLLESLLLVRGDSAARLRIRSRDRFRLLLRSLCFPASPLWRESNSSLYVVPSSTFTM